MGVAFAAFLSAGCTSRGDLRFAPVIPGEFYTISGRLSLPEIVETDLLASSRDVRGDLVRLTNYRTFNVSVGNIAALASSSGDFNLSKVPFSTDMLLTAQSGRVKLLRRIYPRDLYYTDVTNLTVDIKTTARALIWKLASEAGKELSEADITAREYEGHIASITSAIRLALQLPRQSVPKTVLDLPAVTTPVRTAAAVIQSREEVLIEAHSVLNNALLRADYGLIAHYFSPSFGNDWDSASTWDDATSFIEKQLNTYEVLNASYTIHQVELLPGSMARIRVSAEIDYVHRISAIKGSTGVFSADVFWRREGTLWKIHRNLPYRMEHPRMVGADGRWGSIMAAHARLQKAIAVENLKEFEDIISRNFSNDWDIHSTREDLLETTRRRFNANDVKKSDYSIVDIRFIGNDLARVTCRSEVTVINLALGIDITTGPIHAVVDWKFEDGVWRLRRNLPYRFSHPLNIR